MRKVFGYFELKFWVFELEEVCDRIGGGSVAEWLKAHDSKSCERFSRFAGPNPAASAKDENKKRIIRTKVCIYTSVLPDRKL